MISRELWRAVRLSRHKHYQLAARIGMSPSRFSRVINCLETVQPEDPRILRLALLLGVPPWRAFADGPRAHLRALDGRPNRDAPAGVRPDRRVRSFEGLDR